MFYQDTNPRTNRLFSLDANNRGESIFIAGAIGVALDAVRLELAEGDTPDLRASDQFDSSQLETWLAESSDTGVAVTGISVDGQYVEVNIDVENLKSYSVMVDAELRSVSSITPTFVSSSSELATAKPAPADVPSGEGDWSGNDHSS